MDPATDWVISGDPKVPWYVINFNGATTERITGGVINSLNDDVLGELDGDNEGLLGW